MNAHNLAEFFEGVEDLDVSQLMHEYDVKIYKRSDDIYDIINSILERNVSEEAFYIVDIGKIVRQFLKWKECLPDIEPYYAMKCNPNPLVVKILASLGCNFDCASKNEIASVIAITADPKRIVFANPCKMSNQIKYARANDVDLMTFDSDHELYKIKLYHPYADLILRIKVNDSQSKCQFNSKFGIEFCDARELLSIAKSLKLSVVGVAFHTGSNVGSVEQYADAVKEARRYFDLAKEFDMTFTVLDIGGGFPGVDQENGVSFDDIAKTLTDTLKAEFADLRVRLIAEPGRFLVANSHTLVCNVIGKKEVRSVDAQEREFVYYLNDGLYGSFNCIMFDHATPLICPFNERDSAKKYKSKLFGPTCDALDMIQECVYLPELVIGEWCFSPQLGAYSQAAASSFNGFGLSEPIYILTC